MRVPAALIGILFAGAISVHAQKQFQVYASVVDSAGASPATLDAADITVTENGADAKTVKVETVDRKVTVQVLVDNGIGLGAENLMHLRNGVRGVFEALPPGVEAALVTTAPQPRMVVRATTDRQALLKGVDLLSPDSGAGRFVESLNEATQRIERDKTETAPVIIAAGTTSGDTNVMERDVEQLMKRLQTKPTTVHVVVLSAGAGRTASGGGNQTQIGIAVAERTGGRYEGINSPSRLATLLPEIAAQVAKSVAQQSRQFRVTVERPAGASGDLGKISAKSGRAGLSLVALSMDGRIR
jgi:hypothetical protein